MGKTTMLVHALILLHICWLILQGLFPEFMSSDSLVCLVLAADDDWLRLRELGDRRIVESKVGLDEFGRGKCEPLEHSESVLRQSWD